MKKRDFVIIFFAAFFLFNVARAEEINSVDTSREMARQAAGDAGNKNIEKVEVVEEDPLEIDAANPEETFELKGIELDSDLKDRDISLESKEIQEIASRYIGKKVGIATLRKIAADIKLICRQKGWLAAVAYLPEQDSTDGVIKIKIASPTFGKISFNNSSRLADDILKKVGENISKNDFVENDKIENVLYLINEIGGIKARGALVPDSLTHKIDLNINVTNDQTKRGIFYVENYGNKNTGRYRAGLIYDIYNLDNRGSRLEVSGLLSNKDLDNYVIDYSWMTDRKTTSRAGISIGHTTYHQVENYGGLLNAGGHSTDFRIYGQTPVWKTIGDGFTWNYGYKFRDYTQTMDFFGIFHNPGDNYLHTFSVGFSGYNRSLWNDLFNYSFTIYNGYVSPRTTYAKMLADDAGYRGNYFRSQLVLDYRKLFSDSYEFHTNFTLQNASRNLIGAEQLSLGGANGVRGYADGEASGDEGYLSHTEFIWHTPEKGLSLSAFFEIGGVGVKSLNNIRTIRSWGLEANYIRTNDYFLKLIYARKIGNNREIANDDRRQRLWFMAGKIF